MQAPLVPSGPHLAYWDSKDEALVNARGMQVLKLALTIIALNDYFAKLSMTRTCNRCWLPCSSGLSLAITARVEGNILEAFGLMATYFCRTIYGLGHHSDSVPSAPQSLCHAGSNTARRLTWPPWQI